MKHALVVLGAILSLAGCMGGDDTTTSRDASADSVGGSGGASGQGGSSGCIITLQPVDGWTFDSPPFGDSQRLRVMASIGGQASVGGLVWSVAFADATPVAASFPQSGTDRIIEFPVRYPGSYTVGVILAGSVPACAGSKVVTTAAPTGAKRSTFQARLIPPPAASYPPQTKTIQVTHGMPVADNTFTLAKGLAVTLYPVDEAGLAVPGYVRLTREDTGDTFEAHTAAPVSAGTTFTIPSATYDILVVPDDLNQLPPAVFLDQNGDLLDGKKLMVSAGVAVNGTLTVTGTPVAGARVVLRSESEPWLVPSTVTTSDSSGRFTVHARQGTWALAVDPEPGSGLPSVLLPQSTGLSLTADRTIGFDWVAPAARSLSLKVVGASGSSGVANARVMLESSSGSLSVAGTLTLAPGVTQQLAGHVRAEALTGSDGSVTIPGVPGGVYRITAVPRELTSADALTVVTTVDVATTSHLTVSLGSKVSLSGRVTTPSGIGATEVGGARVLALDTEGGLLYPAFAAVVDGTSTFSMLVNPSRQYSLLVLPLPWNDVDGRWSRLAGRAVLGTYQVQSAALEVSGTTVPAGVLYSGVVRGERNDVVPGTIIRLYSTATPPELVVETTAREDGSFILAVPE